MMLFHYALNGAKFDENEVLEPRVLCAGKIHIVDGVPQFSVTRIDYAGNRLWNVFVVTPDGQRAVVTLAEGSVSLRNVVLSVGAVSVLWTTLVGATPLAVGR